MSLELNKPYLEPGQTEELYTLYVIRGLRDLDSSVEGIINHWTHARRLVAELIVHIEETKPDAATVELLFRGMNSKLGRIQKTIITSG